MKKLALMQNNNFANSRGVWGLPQQAILYNFAKAELYKI